jgi:hypothetical protein
MSTVMVVSWAGIRSKAYVVPEPVKPLKDAFVIITSVESKPVTFLLKVIVMGIGVTLVGEDSVEEIVTVGAASLAVVKFQVVSDAIPGK